MAVHRAVVSVCSWPVRRGMRSPSVGVDGRRTATRAVRVKGDDGEVVSACVITGKSCVFVIFCHKFENNACFLSRWSVHK